MILAEIGMKMEKLIRKLAEERKKATNFTSETGGGFMVMVMG